MRGGGGRGGGTGERGLRLTPLRGRVLIVAGSDSGGGAGIQADIKTCAALGAYAATAVTALTAQDTRGVHGVLPVPPDFVATQMRVVLEDIGADAVKIGMLADAGVIVAVAGVLRERAAGVPVVLDPVMVAKGGARLLAEDAVAALLRELLPLATVVTPNAPEAEALLGVPVRTADEARAAAASLRRLGAGAALVKGGHLPSAEIVDVLDEAGGAREWTSARIETRHTHGTGCTLASAVAAGLAQGKALRDAVARARDFTRAAILNAPGLGHGHGPLGHAAGLA